MGAVAALAEERKKAKYIPTFGCLILFIPIAVETAGAFGSLTWTFLKNLGCHITWATGEVRSHSYLVERVSMAIQRNDAATVAGTSGESATLVK